MLLRIVTNGGVLRRWLRLIGRTGLALASAVVLIVSGYGWTLSRQFDGSLTTSAVLDNSNPTDRADSGRSRPGVSLGPMNVLLVGIDSRTDNQGNPLPPASADRTARWRRRW